MVLVILLYTCPTKVIVFQEMVCIFPEMKATLSTKLTLLHLFIFVFEHPVLTQNQKGHNLYGLFKWDTNSLERPEALKILYLYFPLD